MKKTEHNLSIIDQFTKQATPFAEQKFHSNESEFKLMFELSEVNKYDTVLDVACGPGLVTTAFATKAKHVTGIDITPAMIDKAKEIQKEKNLENITLKIGDATNLPFDDESFSMVITRYSFHHFVEPEMVFKEMKRVCKKDGKIMVVDVAIQPGKREAYDHLEKLRDPSHTRACTLDELLNIADKLELTNIKTKWYQLEAELEKQIKASFPNPGDDEKIRQLVMEDIGINNLGINAHLIDGSIYFDYPTVIIVGVKSK
jgi:ubiquinone/menaquinone biosynthesis C-methylase UbiE